MNTQRFQPASEALLPADFAVRVIARVDRVRRRRRITQRVAAAVGASTLVLAVAFEMRPQPLNPTPTLANESQSSPPIDWTTTAAPEVPQSAAQPMALFFPDADSVTRFAEYYGEAGWHSYDSWWTAGS